MKSKPTHRDVLLFSGAFELTFPYIWSSNPIIFNRYCDGGGWQQQLVLLLWAGMRFRYMKLKLVLLLKYANFSYFFLLLFYMLSCKGSSIFLVCWFQIIFFMSIMDFYSTLQIVCIRCCILGGEHQRPMVVSFEIHGDYWLQVNLEKKSFDILFSIFSM